MIKIIIWGFAIRFFVAVWNGFFGPSFGADGGDALSFHIGAVYYSGNLSFDEFKIGSFYSYVLGIFYFLVNDSLFFGSLLSCIAWLFSAVLLHRSMKLITMELSSQRLAMLFYVLFPSSIFFTSVTLREPYQLLFVNMAVYAALKVYIQKSFVHWSMLLVAVVGMGVLHGALLLFGPLFLIGLTMMIMLRRRSGFSFVKLAVITPILAISVFYGWPLFSAVSYNLEDGFASSVESFQYGALSTAARGNYRDDVSISGMLDLLLFLPLSLFQYFFEPMPWRRLAVVDLPLLMENVIRAWLIWKAVTGLRVMPLHNRRAVLFVFIAFLVIEVIWSVGTINWGTAARHHIPSFGLLLISAFAFSRRAHYRRSSLSLRRHKRHVFPARV